MAEMETRRTSEELGVAGDGLNYRMAMVAYDGFKGHVIVKGQIHPSRSTNKAGFEVSCWRQFPAPSGGFQHVVDHEMPDMRKRLLAVWEAYRDNS